MSHVQREVYWIVAMILFFLERDAMVEMFLFFIGILFQILV